MTRQGASWNKRCLHVGLCERETSECWRFDVENEAESRQRNELGSRERGETFPSRFRCREAGSSAGKHAEILSCTMRIAFMWHKDAARLGRRCISCISRNYSVGAMLGSGFRCNLQSEYHYVSRARNCNARSNEAVSYFFSFLLRRRESARLDSA